MNSSIIAPAVSTPVGPPPQSTTLSSPRATLAGSLRRPLEALQHGEAQVEGVVEVLERDRVLVDAVDAERRRHGAGGDDQRVVAQLVDGAVAAVERHGPGIEVDAGHRRHVHA